MRTTAKLNVGGILDPCFVLRLDQFHNSCGHRTCDEREELPVVANSSGHVLPCFAEDAQLTSIVRLVSSLFPACSSCKQIIQQICVEVLLGT